MYLVRPKGRKLKWDIRVRNWDGRVVKIPGDRDRATAKRIGERVEMLIKAKRIGDPPPAELRSWINNLDDRLAARLIKLGLILVRHRGRNTPLMEWVEAWAKVVGGRKSQSQKHAPQQASKVRRIIASTGAERFSDLDADRVTETINGFTTLGCKVPTPLAPSSRRAYGIAINDFASWLSAKLGIENPLANFASPGECESFEYERQPLTVKQFQSLTTYLDTFQRYRNQKSRWNAHDRKMVYWTAVKTGYRQNELRNLRVFNLKLDERPPAICLKAEFNKNKRKGAVPIPNDLAKALRQYVQGKKLTDHVFPMPRTSGSVVDILRLDLQGAGIPWKLASGEVVDFHAFRSTAITWWLVVDGLLPKVVQVLARLRTLALIQNYSRNFVIDDFTWLNKGPKLIARRPKRCKK
jgi:integrase